MASSQDAWYLSLLGLAEHFRVSKPVNIKACIQCLQAVFNFKPPFRVEARTHLQLGNILFVHTKNTALARIHLEKACELSESIQSFDDVKFESASVLCELLARQQLNKLAKERLRRAIEMSQTSCYWHCRLLFQLAQLHAQEKDYVSACSLLGVGVEFTAISGANYTQVLFLLSTVMLLMVERKLSEAAPLLTRATTLVEALQSSTQQKDYLKVFLLVLQTCYYLLAGQVKCSKSWLKQLQQSVQEISQWPEQEQVPASTCPGDMFMWMSKEELCVVVYLVTVMQSMQAGYMEKAQKYSEKALTQIELLNSGGERAILRTFQLMILEHIVQCRLVMGDNTHAVQQVATICRLCHQHPALLNTHRAQVHTVLGLYAMSMGCLDAAEAQLNAALRTSEERELWTFINMNLAIVYLRTGRHTEFAALHDRVAPDTLASQSHSLRAASFYIQGLHGFLQHQYNDAKRFLRETLKMANSEDLNRLTSCSLVLLGNIFLSLGNNRDSFNMVTPAMQLASKIPDINVQMWASAVLKDLYGACGESGKEKTEQQKKLAFSQTLSLDRSMALQSKHHCLLKWTSGALPDVVAGSLSSSPSTLSVTDNSCLASSSHVAAPSSSPSIITQQHHQSTSQQTPVDQASVVTTPTISPQQHQHAHNVQSQQQQQQLQNVHQHIQQSPHHIPQSPHHIKQSPHYIHQQSPHHIQQQSPHHIQQQSPHHIQQQSPHHIHQQSPHHIQQQSPHHIQQSHAMVSPGSSSASVMSAPEYSHVMAAAASLAARQFPSQLDMTQLQHAQSYHTHHMTAQHAQQLSALSSGMYGQQLVSSHFQHHAPSPATSMHPHHHHPHHHPLQQHHAGPHQRLAVFPPQAQPPP